MNGSSSLLIRGVASRVLTFTIASLCLMTLSLVCLDAQPTTLRVERLEDSGTNAPFRIIWSAEPGVRYELQESDDLTDWSVVDGYPAEATELSLQHPLTPQATRGFFRVRTIPPSDPAPSGMALVPAGAFEMGDSFGDWPPEWGPNPAVPVHTVYVSAFYMDRYEVTKALWDEVYQWAIANGYSFDNPGLGKAANHPVHTVSWYDVVKWSNARSEKEGRIPAYYTSGEQTTVYRTGQVDVQNDWVKWNTGYRLPTEAEWEKAARGGASGRRFPWGDTISHSQANYSSHSDFSYDVSSTREFHPTYATGGYPYTSPVGSFAPNGYGLYDMAGNVWEWCWDWLNGSYYSSSPDTDPRGPTSGSDRVVRGGSWGLNAIYCRAADRISRRPGGRNSSIGFRSVLPSDPAPSGMALVPAGAFGMGDALHEGWDWERPVHTVYVSAFYMDRSEVTKALWDEVRAWAINNGYTDLPVGDGKAANHPVYNVNWYDVVKWSNARSEKEQRIPAYYTSGTQTTIYKTGQVDVQNDWVKWNSGYRLPTEAEWEKAARGGASWQRFPWGNTISHSQANYYSSPSYGIPPGYSYDVSSTHEFHPTYATGGYAYTSPVGSFAPNGYGLYDMAGNVSEWCWDWGNGLYYSSSPDTDPRGPTSGSYRVFRGGSWGRIAFGCRAAYRDNLWPDYRGIHGGFRSVLPPGQP